MREERQVCIDSLAYMIDQLSSDPQDMLTNRFYQAKMNFEDAIQKLDDGERIELFRRYADADVHMEKARVIMGYVKRMLEGKEVDNGAE